VLGHDHWDFFVDQCVESFVVLRKHHQILIKYTILMLSPLRDRYTDRDVHEYLRSALYLELPLEAACARVKEMVRLAPRQFKTRFKNAMHGLATTPLLKKVKNVSDLAYNKLNKKN
jgi:hypothetical protein